MTAVPLSVINHRILVVDDDPEIHDLVEGILQSPTCRISCALDGEQAIDIALRETPNLILLDYALPGANGVEVLMRLRAAGVPRSVPVIFISGNENHKVMGACFSAGAADYIRKPFCIPELQARVNSVFDRMQILGQLEQQALYDPLTRLCNRTSIRNRIQMAIESASISRYALLFLDFDRFKMVNDCFGHDVGDQLLQQIANRLCESLRTSDSIGFCLEKSTAARLGGDEFVILLQGLNCPNDAVLVADRLLRVLQEPYDLSGQRVVSTASIGIVNNVDGYRTPDEVLRDADTAMYEAKSAGKGRYVLFDQAMHDNVQRRLGIENDLRTALANDELFLVYQPIVSLETGRTEGFEALIRWEHPRQGLLSPAVFLPSAEESGLIVPIGAWILDRACEDFSRWQRTLGPAAPSKIHVNVSRKQLLLDLVGMVHSALSRHRILPECLNLEVTENQVMENAEVAIATLRELKEMGVKIAMDDFGTGHSSLACLQELPIDVLKIDKSFIANMERSRNFAAMVHAIIALGQNLKLGVVAEGIETAEQLAMLQSMDCESGQGYYFARPMPANEVEAWLCPAESDAHDQVEDFFPAELAVTG